MKNRFKSLGNVLLKAEHLVVIVCCTAMVLLVFANVLMRYVFKISFQGMEDLIMLFAFGIYFIGAALSSKDETQITADVMSLFIKSPRFLTLLRSFQHIVDAVLIGICAVFSTQQMLFVLGEGSRTSGLKLPVWVIYTVILVGLFLMAFYALFHSVEYFRQFIHFHDDKKEGQA
ncbi:TRAP-type C4-dicarboxylate transport system, small permease component [Oscillibacter sp. PC13]|uniref:TRAP transporter small permease n=1 Tax=Oscillibacter sp. PC13 TaxID=1855299 RepID=UPI0008E4EA3E|nr:TRAP transporter small permease [Oscillibacter sp. PC13]SFP88128.1 TRAP-type C4-dicarboxylate transport system, small permease component [Oscillibacter sp. PC13]